MHPGLFGRLRRLGIWSREGRSRSAFTGFVVSTTAVVVLGTGGVAAASPTGLTVSDLNHGVSASGLANALVGNGVTVSNVSYVGESRAAGTFSTGDSAIIGFGSGIVLDSGKVQTYPTDAACSGGVEGPNTCNEVNGGDNSTAFGLPGDAALTSLSGFPTFDASVLNFDFVPQASTVQFKYVFSSEEYSNYSNTTFNDVFGFFVNGSNCASVPGTSEPVSVNTINNGNDAGGDATPHHADLFRDNVHPTPTINTQMDGLTVVLTCTAAVNPGQTNHMKLAIADASDQVLDSAVFLQAGSLVSSNITLTPATATNPVGSNHTVTATVLSGSSPAPGVTVAFKLTAGPNAGRTGTAVTGASGQATFTYADTGGAGTDTIVATFVDGSGITQTSNGVTATWIGSTHATALAYTGPTSGDYHDPVAVSATLTDTTTPGPLAGMAVTFSLNGSESCTAATNASGSASCSLTPGEPAGSYPLVVSFAGGPGFAASSKSTTFTVTKEQTTLVYTGDTLVANGTTATLSGVLTEDATTPIAGRTVFFTLGAQNCSAITNAGGRASCTVTTNQPSAATAVGIGALFPGDSFYLPARATSTARLTYMTGRAFGLSARASVLGHPLINILPTPDTGAVSTSTAGTKATPCIAKVPGSISATVLCANVTTAVAPGTSKATATLATLGITGLTHVPAISATAIAAYSTSTCSGASGAATFASLIIAGVRYQNYSPAANTTLVLPSGLGKIVLNEQLPVAGADHGLTVNAIHITVPSLKTDVVVASATSDIHNCNTAAS